MRSRELNIAVLFCSFGLVIGGCGSGDICQEAANHLASCTGLPAKTLHSCDEQVARQILDTSCEQIGVNGKADGSAYNTDWQQFVYDENSDSMYDLPDPHAPSSGVGSNGGSYPEDDRRPCRANSECLPGEFCKYPIGYCGSVPRCLDEGTRCLGAEVPVCAEIPEYCPAHAVEPVCGCDGSTYWSPCAAARDGQSLRYRGPCKAAPSTYTFGMTDNQSYQTVASGAQVSVVLDTPPSAHWSCSVSGSALSQVGYDSFPVTSAEQWFYESFKYAAGTPGISAVTCYRGQLTFDITIEVE